MQVSEALLVLWQDSIDQRAWRFNQRVFRLGHALLQHYQQVKQQDRVLDFNDIEWQADRLLSSSEDADYLLHKLDARYRHILLDEFQDTNPLQWRILSTWLEASTQAGHPAGLFVVGDPKQSIYRFRGAQAGLFQRVRDRLREQGAHYLTQHCTRRSASPVIHALNACFARLNHSLYFEHEAHNTTRPGRVEVLPLAPVEAAASVMRTPCRNPLDTPPTQNPGKLAHEREAAQLVQGIHAMVGHWHIEDAETGQPRPARYSDIMLLVRKRTHLAIYQETLKAAQIPYASDLGGGLLDGMEIGDLIAQLRSLIDPEDKLARARALRSPIFGATDHDLQQLRLNQLALSQPNWWYSLVHMPPVNAVLTAAAAQLARWRALAIQLPVHDLLDHILHEAQLHARYAASVPTLLAQAVHANLDAFLELSLTLSGGRYPSLPRFLDELARLQQHRDEQPDEGEPQQHEDRVRIHTVHGAKGLESPIVWLLDSGGQKPPGQHYQVLCEWPAEAARPQHFSVLATQELLARWQTDALARDQQQAETESLNQQYVAMTRARQVLMVSASSDKGAENWHQSILAALADLTANQSWLGDDMRSAAYPTTDTPRKIPQTKIPYAAQPSGPHPVPRIGQGR